ncbi:MAG: MarR family transcriptional regulator [Chloroflexi bacterium]|nr:MarR family transcriptional regulator [Chloroflexota bacterium]
MTTRKGVKPALTKNVKAALKKEPGLTVKDLAERLEINRQFMAGALAVLEEKGDVYHRNVGPARIYFPVDGDR